MWRFAVLVHIIAYSLLYLLTSRHNRIFFGLRLGSMSHWLVATFQLASDSLKGISHSLLGVDDLR